MRRTHAAQPHVRPAPARTPRGVLCLLAAALLVATACDDDGGKGTTDTTSQGDASDTTQGDGSDSVQGDAPDLSRDVDAVLDGTSADTASTDRDQTGDQGDTHVAPPSRWTCGALELAPSTAATTLVPVGADLQAAIDAAQPGDTLVLAAGGTYRGHFVLPAKSGDAVVTLRTSTPDVELPPGVRVQPSDAPRLARLASPGAGLPALRTDGPAHHYRLVGLELMPEAANSEVYEVLALGTSAAAQSSLAQVPHHLIVDRSFIHGWPDANFKRGIGLNSASTCVTSSHVSDFHSDFQDSQAIGGFNGPGPFRIVNNRLEGAAENIMFGGAVPSIPGLTPSDIEVRGNHLVKPLAWRAGDPANTGYVPWVKNLFELKHARRVVLDGNVLENNWVGADQHGVAVVLTPRSEGGAVPWAIVDDVRVSHNVFRHVGGGVGILGRDVGDSSEQTRDIVVAHNLFEDVRADYALDIVRVLQFTGIDGLVIDHNTFVYGPGSWPLLRAYGDPTTGFAYTNNVVEFREGLWSDCGNDATAISCALAGGEVAGNVFIGGGAGSGLSNANHFPATLGEAGFVNHGAGAADFHNYALAPTSAYASGATDGTTPGFDAAAVDAAMKPD